MKLLRRALPAFEMRDALVGRVAVGIAAMMAVAVAATVLGLAFPVLGERFRGQPARVAYANGDLIDVDPKAYSSARRTVFFFSRFSCGGCQASKGVMASIVAAVRERSDARVVLVTGRAFPDEERIFASELGVDPAFVYQTDLQHLRVRLVPTVVLTDATGKILMVREGVVTEDERNEIVSLVDSSKSPGP